MIRIEFLTKQISILKQVKSWPGIEDEIEAKRKELREILRIKEK